MKIFLSTLLLPTTQFDSVCPMVTVSCLLIDAFYDKALDTGG